MPRYFFHTMDGRAAIDVTGLTFENEKQARQEAMRGASEMLVDPEMGLWLGNRWIMVVADENGYVLFNVKINIEQTIRPSPVSVRQLAAF